MQDKPILQVEKLSKQYGPGCSVCTECSMMKYWRKIIVHIAERSMLAVIFRLTSTQEKFLG